jgi:hypothetical protein
MAPKYRKMTTGIKMIKIQADDLTLSLRISLTNMLMISFKD